MDPNDELARLRAETDQHKEGLKEVAGTLWALFNGLVEEGFNEEHALTIVLTWMTNLQHGEDGE